VRGAIPHVDERTGIEMGGAFNSHNVGKLGITINLRTDAGKEQLYAASVIESKNDTLVIYLGFDDAPAPRVRRRPAAPAAGPSPPSRSRASPRAS